MFDNNRTYQQRTPTQTKSVFQQAGQAGGQFARGSVGGIAKIANTAAAQAPQVSDTIRQQIAARTNNPNAFRAATERLKATEAKFNRNAGGLLNQGTIWNKDEVQRGDLKTGLRAVPVTAQAMVEGYTLGTGAPVGASIKEFGVKQGLQKSVPALTKTFGGNVAQGGITAYNQGAKGKDILKSAALSGALGTVGDVGLGVVGAAARPILSDAVGKVYGATKASKVDPLESLKQEARKYKSADTFAMNIKDKEVGDNLVVYKGTGGDLDMGGARGFDYLKKVGESQKDMPKNTSSFSQDKFFARQYGDVTPYTVPKKDIMPKEQYSKLIGEVTGVGDNSGTALRGMWRRSDKYPSIIPDVKKAGYKGFTDVNGEIVMFDRSSLTDLYNQATQPPKSTPEAQSLSSPQSIPDPLESLKQEARTKTDPRVVDYNSKPKEGTIRLYTNTKGKNVDSILKEGLKTKQRLQGYGADPSEGSVSWFETTPNLKGYGGNTIAVDVPLTARMQKVNDTQYTVFDDLSPDNIVFVDKPLFGNYRTSDIKGLVDKYGDDKVREVFKKSRSKNITEKELDDILSATQPPKSSIDSLKQEARTTEPIFERDINTGKMKMQSSKQASKEKYSIANSDISRTKNPGMNQDGFTVEDWGGKKRFVSLDDASPETKMKVRKAEAEFERAKANSTGVVAPGTKGPVQIAREKLNDAYSDAIDDLKLQDYATTENGGRTFNSKYNDWLETKYKDRNIDSATIKDMATNPQKYRSQFEAETATQSQPPKSTPPVKAKPQVEAKATTQKPKAEAKPKVGVKSLDEAGGGAVGDSEVLSAIQKARTPKNTGYDTSNLSIGQKLSPDRIIRDKITHPLEQKIQRGLFNAQTSDIALVRGFGRLMQGVSKEAGVTDELLAAKRKLHGGIETGKLLREDIVDAGAGFDKATKERVWASLDPEQAAKTGTVQAKLTPEETVYREGLKKQIDAVTQGNLDRGLITPEQAANGDYLKRGYSIFEEGTDNSKAYQQTREALLKQFKGRKDVTGDLLDSAIKDPSYLVAKKTAESNAAWAMVDYGKHLSDTGLTSPVAKPGYVQLPSSKVFGDAAGMYVPKGVAEDFTGFQYNNGIISAFNDMITAYDSLGIRKAKKELLTIFNPAVRTGNQFSNRVVFSNLNGINPIQFEKNMIAAKSQIKARGPLYREAVSQGLTGLDITQADFAKRIATATGEPNLASKAIEYAKKSYSQADDQARVAAYITHRNRGYPPAEAARLTQRGFQDYKSVGFFYDIAAKTPLIGNAFVRFAGDATRIAKNAALDHPLRTASTIALWATFVNAMSKISGESPEDKKTREDRFGAPKLPFTDISTAVQTPWGEINVSRFLPFYQLNDIQGSVSKLLPLSKSPISYKDGKVSVDPAGFNDPLLGQFVQLAADKDFRGRSIKDPENTGQFVEPLSSKDQKKNQAGWLATGNLPLGREINSVYSAAKGGEDLYGKKRSLPQAAARALGVKVEQFGPEQAKKQRATNTYFEEKKQIDDQIKGLPAKDQEAYKRLTGYYKLRATTPNEFKPNEDRNVKAPVYEFPEDKWKEYTTSPKLYDLAIEKKYKDAERQGTPIQPEFDKRLSTEFRKQLINNKSLAPGEDVEADARMYDSSEWDTYQKIKKEYTDKASKYYPQKSGEFVDELVKHKAAAFPDKPPAKAAYDAAYAKYANGQGPKPAFNDAVAAAKDKYSEDKRVWTNIERKARGLPPISKEVWDNVTFGFESDEEKVYKELKYGKGFGGYGSGRTATSYAGKSKVSVKGTVAKPKISTKSPGKLQGSVKYAASSKPKVSIKKSLV